jgi:hypothetical protein
LINLAGLRDHDALAKIFQLAVDGMAYDKVKTLAVGKKICGLGPKLPFM